MKFSLIISCVAASLVLGGCRSAHGYLEKGNRLFDASKYEDAELEYKKAIQKDGRFSEGYYRLALADLKLHQANDAYGALNRAVTYDSKNFPAKIELAGLCLTSYSQTAGHPAALFNQAQSLVKDILAANPESAPGLVLRARIQAIDRKPDAAIEDLRHALRNSPNDSRIESALAEELIATKQANEVQEGEKLAKGVISRHADFAPAYEVLYRFYMEENRAQDAEALLKSWQAGDPKNPTPVLRLAYFYFREQKRDQSEQTLSILTQRRDVYPDAYLLAGDFHSLVHDTAKAVADYRNGLSGDAKHDAPYLERMAGALAVAGRYGEVIQTADKLLAKDPTNGYANAIKIDSLLALGGQDHIAAAAKLGQDAAQKNPNDFPIQLAAGEALLEQGDLDVAEAHLQQAARLGNGSPLVHLALARLNLMKGKYGAVLTETNTVAAIQPDSQEAKILRIIGLTGSGLYAEAKAEALQLPAGAGDAAREMQLGNIALAQKRFPEAEEHFQKLYHKGVTGSPAVAALVNTYMAENKTGEALQLAEDELKRAPSQETSGALVAAAISAKKFDLALAELQKLAAANPNSADLQVKIGETQVSLGNLPAAIQAFQKAQQLALGRLNLDAAIGVLQDRLGRKQEAISSYRKALKKNQNDPTVLNNLAFLLADTGGDLNEALQLATQVNRLESTSSSAKDTLAWVEVKRGNSTAAAVILSALTRNDPANASFHYHYGAALLASGNRHEAREELEQALSLQPSPSVQEGARTLLAKLP